MSPQHELKFLCFGCGLGTIRLAAIGKHRLATAADRTAHPYAVFTQALISIGFECSSFPTAVHRCLNGGAARYCGRSPFAVTTPRPLMPPDFLPYPCIAGLIRRVFHPAHFGRLKGVIGVALIPLFPAS